MSEELEIDQTELQPGQQEVAKSPELQSGQEKFIRSLMSGALPKLQDKGEQSARDDAFLQRVVERYGQDLAEAPDVAIGSGLFRALCLAFSGDNEHATTEQRVDYILELARRENIKVSKRVQTLLPKVVEGYQVVRESIQYSRGETREHNPADDFIAALKEALTVEKRLSPDVVFEIAGDVYEEDLPDNDWRDWDAESRDKIDQALSRLSRELLPDQLIVVWLDNGPEVSFKVR